MGSLICSVEGCDKPGRRHGMCVAHWERVKRHGDPLAHVPVRERSGTIIKKLPRATYRFVWNPSHPLAHRDNYVAEHRMVAWDAGLLTDPSHHVHHVNHDQLDNRIENLEVLSPGEHRRRHAATDGTRNQFGWHPPKGGVISQLLAMHANMYAITGSSWAARFDPLANTRAAWALYQGSGAAPWT
jgi:hypothetical protein